MATGAGEDKMKQLNLRGNAGLAMFLVVFAGGCAVKIPAPIAVEELATSVERVQPRIDAARTSHPAKPGAAASKEAPGMVVHIDPTTGEFLPEPPADGTTPPRAAEAAQVSIPQFYEVPSPTPGGGIMIDLQGHFHMPSVATMDDNGKLTVTHEPAMPAGAKGK
jgi:hypothetical protein